MTHTRSPIKIETIFQMKLIIFFVFLSFYDVNCIWTELGTTVYSVMLQTAELAVANANSVAFVVWQKKNFKSKWAKGHCPAHAQMIITRSGTIKESGKWQKVMIDAITQYKVAHPINVPLPLK